MPLELSHSIHPEYLEVHVSGERSHGIELEESFGVWSQVFSVSLQQHRLNILAHNRARGRFPVKAQIDLSFKIQEMGCTLDHRVAVISYNKEVTKDAQIIIRFMSSKGYTVQFFTSRDKAIRWLLREKKKPSILDIFDSFK